MKGGKEGQLGTFLICNLQGFRGVDRRAGEVGTFFFAFSSRLHFAHVAIIFPFAGMCPFSLVCWSLLDGIYHFFLFFLGVMGAELDVLAPECFSGREPCTFSSPCRAFFAFFVFSPEQKCLILSIPFLSLFLSLAIV